LQRRLRARILVYYLYTPVLCAVPPCTHEKITIFRGALKLLEGSFVFEIPCYNYIKK